MRLGDGGWPEPAALSGFGKAGHSLCSEYSTGSK